MTQNHAQVYKKYSGKARDDKVEELEQSLKQQQSLFKNVRHVSDAAVKASYIISNEIAASSRPFTEGDFVKKCMLLTADVICPDKRQAFANVSLSRNTIAERINEIAEDIDNQLQSKVKSFVAFSVAIDESTDVCDVAQLAVFIRGVDENMQVTEAFVELVPMKGTTKSDDIFASLVRALDKLGVDWKKCVSLATDGAPQMVGRKAGVVAKLQEKLMALNPDNQFLHEVKNSLKLQKVREGGSIRVKPSGPEEVSKEVVFHVLILTTIDDGTLSQPIALTYMSSTSSKHIPRYYEAEAFQRLPAGTDIRMTENRNKTAYECFRKSERDLGIAGFSGINSRAAIAMMVS
ncbi:zinc finger MYM-type protein 6-like [Macrobrachium rosenbergii]|uniref:zinc finger MYM-type protein 6-like n=1 Tax=Macrobrachium rosenbergii TaxID=79674 RepID=UPI0034D5FD09